MFVNDGDFTPETFGMTNRSLDATLVRTNHHDLRWIQHATLKVGREDRSCVKVVYGNVEETLDLRCMQIHRKHSIGSGPGDHIRDQLGRNWRSAFVLPILPGVAIIGHDGGDSRSAGALAGIDHDQQFHQVVVDRRTSRLNQVNVPPTHVVFDFAVVFAVRELVERDGAKVQMQKTADVFGQLRVRPTTKNF